eukprot:Tbor_TRINITY_DN3004_c0_g1::TRINITY_DN3004_c0_g1_i1::g.17377::m.17377/K04638/IFT57, HIPPI, ESRRBL1; intraflagellar transport protein 57
MGDEEQPTTTAPIAVQTLGAPPVLDDATMEDLIEKLKLLNYETEFCLTTKPPFKLLGRLYFMTPDTNVNAQFFYFTSLVAWLMKTAGHNGFPAPGQFDDPNATSTNIVEELRAMGLQTQGLAPNRIRQGSGEAVLLILAMLVDAALIATGFTFRPIVYPDEKAEDWDTFDTTRGGTHDPNEIDDNVAVDSEEEDEMYVVETGRHGGHSADHDEDMIVSQVTADQWNIEVERVSPMLQIRSDEVKDWRARIEVAGTLLKAVQKMYPDVKTMLLHMGADMEKNRDRIQKREQTLSQQFNEHVEEYRTKLRELSTSQELHSQSSTIVGNLSNELNSISELLDKTKEDIENREAKISDTSPLMQIKDAVAKVRSETKQMSLRIGVLQHTVLHYNLRLTREKREGKTKYAQSDDDSDSDFSFKL